MLGLMAEPGGPVNPVVEPAEIPLEADSKLDRMTHRGTYAHGHTRH